MLIIKLLYITLTSILKKNSNYIYRYRFKNQLRTFQPENGRKFKNKPGWPKNHGSKKKRCVLLLSEIAFLISEGDDFGNDRRYGKLAFFCK